MEESDMPQIHYKQCALDIGGTLAKIVFCTDEDSPFLDLKFFNIVDTLTIYRENPKRTYYMTYIQSKDIDDFIQWLQDQGVRNVRLSVTGGGAFKYADRFKKCLNCVTVKHNEMESLMKGLSFLLMEPKEIVRFDLSTKQLTTVPWKDPVYPCLLVNIGSGVSILKADSPHSYQRLTGTCVGGGTVLGLAQVLLGVTTFQEIVDLSEKGSNILDLDVSDILGDTAGSYYLPSDTLASSFGRLSFCGNTGRKVKSIKREDIARSLIYMVAYNLGYMSYLVGTIHSTNRIIFTGKFIHNHCVTMEAITEGLMFYVRHYDLMKRHDDLFEPQPTFREFVQQAEQLISLESSPPFEILFLKHDGYLGALGAQCFAHEA